MNRGLNLLIQHGKPEEILPSLAKTFEAHTVKDLSHSFVLCNEYDFWGYRSNIYLANKDSLSDLIRCMHIKKLVVRS